MSTPAFHLLGLQVRSSGPATLLSSLQAVYSRAALVRPVEHTVHVQVRPGRRVPDAAAFQVGTHTGAVAVAPEDDRSVWIHGRTQDAHLTTGPGESVIELWTETGTNDEPLMVAFTEVLRTRGFLPLHAAVVEREGRALALLGPSGTGKSTTMLRALRAGYHPVTEDYGLYEPRTGLLHGLDLGLRCLPDTLERVRASFHLSTPPEVVRGKALVTWDMLGLPHTWQAPLEAASLLHRDARVPSGEAPLPPAHRVMALWAATGVPLLPATREWTSTQVAHLAQNLNWTRRTLGNTAVQFGKAQAGAAGSPA